MTHSKVSLVCARFASKGGLVLVRSAQADRSRDEIGEPIVVQQAG